MSIQKAFAAGELKHGPLALIDRNSYVLLVNPNDIASEDNIASAYEIKARGAKIIGISDRPNNVYDKFIKIPSVKRYFLPYYRSITLSNSGILFGACKECRSRLSTQPC